MVQWKRTGRKCLKKIAQSTKKSENLYQQHKKKIIRSSTLILEHLIFFNVMTLNSPSHDTFLTFIYFFALFMEYICSENCHIK